uniref:Lipase_3 domain-containing protein n=1 Tax=Panagrellus redivivus TaxID=6233 RepID=A0A7E4VEJ8_PANRE
MLSLTVFSVLLAVSGGSYSDSLSRNKFSALAGAAYSSDPQECLTNAFTNAELVQQVSVSCDYTFSDTCSGFVAVSHGDNAVIVAFRGTTNFIQLITEGNAIIFTLKTPFPAGGNVAKYFYNGYNATWEGGLKDSFLNATNANPGYSIWITGHSLGGAFATLAASEIVSLGYAPAENVTLYTYGQPRVGDAAFATAHDNQGFESYRVTHSQDIVPHIPSELFEGYTQHKSEVWYNNDMTVGSTYVECDADESSSCSDSNWFDLSISDHLHYFNRSVSGFGHAGCVNSFEKWIVDRKLDEKVNAIWQQKFTEQRKAAAKNSTLNF